MAVQALLSCGGRRSQARLVPSIELGVAGRRGAETAPAVAWGQTVGASGALALLQTAQAQACRRHFTSNRPTHHRAFCIIQAVLTGIGIAQVAAQRSHRGFYNVDRVGENPHRLGRHLLGRVANEARCVSEGAHEAADDTNRPRRDRPDGIGNILGVLFAFDGVAQTLDPAAHLLHTPADHLDRATGADGNRITHATHHSGGALQRSFDHTKQRPTRGLVDCRAIGSRSHRQREHAAREQHAVAAHAMQGFVSHLQRRAESV